MSTKIRSLLLPILLGVALCAPQAYGSRATLEGAPPLLLTVLYRQRGDKLRLGMHASGNYANPAKGTVHLLVPPGLAYVRGDTVRTAHTSKWGLIHTEWELALRPVAVGRSELRGILEVDAGSEGLDRLEMLLPIEVGPEMVIIGDPIWPRAERIRGDQRFRFGGVYLVPLDATEDAGLAWHKDQYRAVQATHTEPAICPTCPGKLPRKVQLIAFIGRDGGLREIRNLNEGALPTDTRVPPPEVMSAAKAALKKWRFTPSYTTSGEPLSDYLETWVEVRSE